MLLDAMLFSEVERWRGNNAEAGNGTVDNVNDINDVNDNTVHANITTWLKAVTLMSKISMTNF